MKPSIFIPFDCESGGIGKEVSLLSVHFAACDEDWNINDELDLLVKPNDGIYKVTAEALTINNIDLIEHDKKAITYSQAGSLVRDFIMRNSGNGRIKLIPMGKNIGGDVDWVTQHLLGNKTWNQYVSYREYDITSVITYAKRKGILDATAPESLEGLAKYWDIHARWHTARGDNLAGIQVMQTLEALGD
jgi:hypothetical protein